MTDQTIIHATRTWLNSFVIALNICPFAHREQQRNSIRYHVAQTLQLEEALEILIMECEFLDTHPETETTLLILPAGFDSFDDYLDMLAMAEQLMTDQGYEGVYQLASFHPEYCFEAAAETDNSEDPANYTNRSPYPMLHIIRETSIERAVAKHPDPDNIPVDNIKLTRELGLKKLQAILSSCYPEI